MIRFPNPGSDLEYFLKIFKSIFNELKEFDSFNLDDITKVLINKNLASSGGYIGDKALQISTRKDRSRDPLYNQSKMYAELYRHMGWLLPSDKKLNYKFSILGYFAYKCEKINQKKFIRQCLLGITFPNVNILTKSVYSNRPFKTILDITKRLDNRITRDEIILGPLSIVDDRNPSHIENMVDYILKIRNGYLDINNELITKSEKENKSINTLKNYTRFPIGAMKWANWTNRIREGKNVYFELTEVGLNDFSLIENSIDIRALDIADCSENEKSNLIKIGLKNLLENADINNDVFNKILLIDKKNKQYSKKILFSPFHSIEASFFQTKAKTIKDKNSSISFNGENKKRDSLNFHIGQVNARKSVLKSNIIKILKKYLNNNNGDIYNTKMRIKSRYINSNQETFYPIVRDLFLNLEIDCSLSRHGINYQRQDAIILTKNDSIPIEIKSPGEEVKISIKAVRQALENKIVILSRKSFPMQMETSSIIVGFEYPNDRSEVYRAIIDIKNTYQIKIGMLDFDTLIHLNIQKLLQKKIPDLKKLKKLIGKGTI